MTNRQIADVLFNIATVLDMAQDNIYRVRAYRRAARRILALREEAMDIVARGDTLTLPGVGTRIGAKLAEMLASGRLRFYEDLVDDLPDPVGTLMALEGVGPKTAESLYMGLRLRTPDDVLAAAEAGRIRTLYGFGPRREAALAQAARTALQRPPAAA